MSPALAAFTIHGRYGRVTKTSLIIDCDPGVDDAVALLLARSLGLEDKFPPAVAAYWVRMQEREGFISAKAAQARASAEQGLTAVPLDQLS